MCCGEWFSQLQLDSLSNGNIEGRIYDVGCSDADMLVAHQADYFKEKRI